MKVGVLSLLVLALLVASTANTVEAYNKDGNKLDLYDKVGGLHYLPDGRPIDGGQTYMYLNFKGETQVTNQLTDYGQWEYQIQGNAPESENNSQTCVTFVGLKFRDIGPFDYGCSYDVVYDVTSWADVLLEFDGDAYNSGNFMQQRGSGFATYRNTDFFGLVSGLNFTVQYQGQNGSVGGGSDPDFTGHGITNNGYKTLHQDGDGVGGSITYDYEGFGVGVAVSSSRYTWDQDNTGLIDTGDRTEAYIDSLKYDANNIYLAAQYTQTYDATRVDSLDWANRTQNFEAVAQYQFDFGLRPSVAYLQSKSKDLGVVAGCSYDDEDILKYVGVGVAYYFSKNMSIYVGYKINLLDNNRLTRATGINASDIVALGLVHQS